MREDELFQFYNKSEEYFYLSERAHSKGGLFPIHRKILNECKNRKGLIVDLGCGTGLDVLAMTSGDNFCLGFDISGLAVKRARKSSQGKNNIDFKRADLSQLPLKDCLVDVVTSFYTLEHLLAPKKVLSEIDRILKPGGELFLLCPNFASPFRGAPVFGGIRKTRILKKMIKSFLRMLSIWVLRRKDFKVRMIPEHLINLNKIGYDWDATCEPSLFEFVKYFKRRGYQVESKSWLSPPKTKIEKFFRKFKSWPIIKYWGPICYLYAKK